MFSVSYAGKNAYSASKTSGVLGGDASGAKRCHVLAHCARRGAICPLAGLLTQPPVAGAESLADLKHSARLDFPGWVAV